MSIHSIIHYSYETLLFLKRWISNPKSIGAFIPSSQSLAKQIAQEAMKNLTEEHYIIELGAGTGVFTHALLESGLSANRLICIEIDPIFVAHLKKKFPAVTIIEGSATLIDNYLPASLNYKVGCIISGLPLLNFNQEFHLALLKSCLNILQKGGSLLQFTYGFFSPLRVTHEAIYPLKECSIWLNMPPAAIWRYTKLI